MMDRFMRRFSTWFGSPKGVYQTFLVTTAIGIIEQIFPSLDPQHFFYLYLMTYYSTVTQTLLAYASNVSSESHADLQEQIHDVQQTQTEILLSLRDMMLTVIAIAQRLESGIEGIAEDVEELTEEFADEEDVEADNARKAAVKQH